MSNYRSSAIHSLSRACLLILLGAMPAFSQAGAEVLVRGQGVVVTADDVLAETERLPDELRQGVLTAPVKLEQLTANLYVRRVLAKQAQEAGLDRTPRVAAAQRIASDKILSDAFLANAVADRLPGEEALEKLARTYYAGEDKQFAALEQRKIRHILVAKTHANAQARALEVLEKLRNGADFSALAKEYSDDPGTKNKGGDLGYFGRGRMVKAFEDAAFGIDKTGELAGPIETPFGVHILRLDGIRPPGKLPYDEVSTEIKRTLREKLAGERRLEIAAPIRETIEFDRGAIEAFARQYH